MLVTGRVRYGLLAAILPLLLLSLGLPIYYFSGLMLDGCLETLKAHSFSVLLMLPISTQTFDYMGMDVPWCVML